jgi:hypothetical protein
MKALFFATLALVPSISAALAPNTGTASGEFLRLGAGARSAGMGEAYTAVAEGPEAIYWNPAGLGGLKFPEVTYARSELPAGLHHDFLSAGVPVAWFGGGAAFSVTRLTQDNMNLVDMSNQPQGSFAPRSLAYSLGYGRNFALEGSGAKNRDYFNEKWNLPFADHPFDYGGEQWEADFAFGAAVKAVTENLGTRQASTLAVDAGGAMRPAATPGLTLGAALRNAGGSLRFIQDAEPLPAEGAAGAAFDLRGDDFRLVSSVEAAVPYAGSAYAKAGVEYSRPVASGMSAAGRLGYSSRTAGSLGGLSGLTVGVGLQAYSFKFDAAFQPIGVLGSIFRIGVGWKFESTPRKAEALEPTRPKPSVKPLRRRL